MVALFERERDRGVKERGRVLEEEKKSWGGGEGGWLGSSDFEKERKKKCIFFLLPFLFFIFSQADMAFLKINFNFFIILLAIALSSISPTLAFHQWDDGKDH